MTRRTIASLGLVTLLAATPALADRVLERDFRTIEGFRGIYLVSIPYSATLADLANSGNAAYDQDTCDLSIAGGDGVINADDLICAAWGGGDPAGRVGMFSLSRLVDNAWQTRTAVNMPDIGRITIGPTFPMDLDVGYQVEVPYFPELGPRDNELSITAPCEPRFPGYVLEGGAAGVYRRVIVHLPDDTVYTTATELICGRRGVDWDLDGRGYPDDCLTGLWAPGIDNVIITVAWFDNHPGAGLSGLDNLWMARSVFDGDQRPGATYRVAVGPEFPVLPGEAYVLYIQDAGSDPVPDRTWDPHVDAAACGDSNLRAAEPTAGDLLRRRH